MHPKQTTPVPDKTVSNGDEQLDFGGARYIGNFHKTLPRHVNGSGEVDPKSYVAMAEICDQQLDCEFIAASTGATKLINPLAGRAHETLGPDPQNIHMTAAPSVLSDSTAAEIVELFWMAKLRDLPLDQFDQSNLKDAVADIASAYGRAVNSETHTIGDLRLGLDLPQKSAASGGALDINLSTLFRAGLKDEEHGPLISQFLLHDINYGAQLVRQTQVPYKTGADYLTGFIPWLDAQRTGKDGDGNAYPTCNNFTSNPAYFETSRRRIATMRDMARFVNRDALHQAYFNAALLLDAWGAQVDSGNPYRSLYKRQVGFGTLGGPNLLAMVTEVSTRALKAVWRQKWLHRRLRPEAYGGLMHVQHTGGPKGKRDYGLPTWLFDGGLKISPYLTSSDYFLPIAFTAGSPAHPAYGAGHATVAGACVTVLKAWFDEDVKMTDLFKDAPKPKDPSPYFPAKVALNLWQPGSFTDGPLPVYAGADAMKLTVGGELNKLAANVALGRGMGGVHWRSDNTRSLRLGEQVATIMLKRILPTYAERPLSLSYTNFDRNLVTIQSDGSVKVADDPNLEAFYTRQF